MKTLLLVRHAKSSWKEPGLQDFERPLLEKGKSRTEKVAIYLRERKVFPDLIVSSHAVRAFETAKIFAEVLGYPHHEIQVDGQVYFSGATGLQQVAFGLPDGKNTVIMVGHNPAITQFANEFLENKIDYMPTSAVVSISFDTAEWKEIPLASKKINFVVYPKML